MSNDLPRVSEVLAVLESPYNGVPAPILKAAEERGTALHQLVCRHLASMLDLCASPSEVEDQYRDAYAGFLDWVNVKLMRPILVEEVSANERYRYRGTPDALGYHGPHQYLTVVEFKFTAQLLRLNSTQVRAYWQLRDYAKARQAILVHIDPHTGKWEEKRVYQDPRDWAGFLGALNVVQWRRGTR